MTRATTKEGLALARQYFAGFPHDEGLPGEILAPEIVFHHLVEIEGRAAFERFMRMVSAAFPDFQFDIHHLVAEGDLVAGHFTFAGTHAGEFLGALPATGRRFSTRGMNLFRIEEGRIVEIWTAFNALSMLQQLGVVVPGLGSLRPP